MMGTSGLAQGSPSQQELTQFPGGKTTPGLPELPHFQRKAKSVIYLFMCGGPSHIDTYDFKPELRKIHGTELPDSVRKGQRITGMTSGQKKFPCVAPMFKFNKFGEHGTYVSEILPYTAGIVDDISIIKSVNTEAINHDPAITFINTGTQQPGRASLGSWVSYGLGSPNDNFPAYVVMISKGPGQKQALYERLWSSGFLPSKHQGVKMRGGAEPVLYLNNPKGVDRPMRRRMLDRIRDINQQHYDQFLDPETQTRIAQYEMAFRMQQSVPELMDLSNEPEYVFDMYGPDSKKPGSFARNCIIARRMAERGIPMMQLFHRGWDQHGSLPKLIRGQCKTIDQPSAALVQDLKQRGMLDDTLVIWGGEFGRTIYSQGALTKDNHGRDHHGRCFTMWMSGGGIKRGMEYGKTDDHCYNIVENPVHIRDFNATILHQLGINHNKLTFRYQGLDQKLTGVEPARVIKEILA
ncbi:DUF1501 domain-containing protein [Mariniblastus sp.]|nr:DUF1501 domain-containing protein [Mariniblastus sp.]MDB4756763.1 DUF1501 domain-containing protein [Mariniblastus sp.]